MRHCNGVPVLLVISYNFDQREGSQITIKTLIDILVDQSPITDDDKTNGFAWAVPGDSNEQKFEYRVSLHNRQDKTIHNNLFIGSVILTDMYK